jgi:hypothetical protein
LLKMGPLNFQQQHAGHFWFRETAGEVSRQLNTIVNLDLIDTTIANIDREQRKTKIRLQDVESRMKTARGEKRRFSYVRLVERRIGALNGAIGAYDRDRTRVKRLTALITQAREYDTLRSRRVPSIKPLLSSYRAYRKAEDQYTALSRLMLSVRDYEKDIQQMQRDLQEATKQLRRSMGKQCPLCNSPLTRREK